MKREAENTSLQELAGDGSVSGILESFAPSQPDWKLQTAPVQDPSREVKAALLISITLLALGVLCLWVRPSNKSKASAE